MNTIYKVDFNSLKSKLDELENEYSNFSNVAYKNYLDSYLKTFGGSTLITSMKDSLDSLYSNVNNGYKKIIDWLDNYYTISNNIENVLAKNLQLGSISEDNIRNYIENKLLNIESSALTFTNIPKLEKMGFNFFNNNDTYTNFSKSSSNKNYSKSDIKNKITKDSMIEHKSKNPYWLNNHLMDEYSNEKSALENKFTNFIIKNERSIKIKSNNELGFKSYYTEQELTKYVLENPEYFKNLLSSEEFKNIVGMTYEEYVEAIDTYNCQIATCKASMYATKQEQKQAQYVELMQSEDFLKFKSTISTEEAKYYCLTNLKYLGIDTLASIGYLSDDETLLLVYLYQNEGKKSVKKFIGAYEDKINQAKGKAEADKYIAKITDDKAFSNFVTAMSNGVEIKSIDDVKAFINLEFNETDQEILKEINECLFNYYTDAGLSNEYLVVNNENSALAVVQTYTNLKNAYGIDIANTYVSNIEQCLNDCSLTLNISIKDGASKYFTTFGQGFGDGIESFTEGFENIFRTEGMISDNQYAQMYIASYLNGKTSLNLDYQISTSIGNMTPTVVLATLTGGTMQPVVTALNFASSFGNTYNQGLINGNNNMSSALNAVVVAGSDSVIEALAGGINALRLKPAAKAIEDTAEQALKKALKVKLKDSLVVFAKGFVPNAFKEGGQEAFQSYLEAYSNKLFFGDEVDLAETSKEALYSATVGAFTASIMNSANFVSSLAQTITVHGINKEIEIGARIKFDNEIINGNIDLSQYNNVEEAFKSYITNNPDVMNFGSLKYIFNKMGNDFVSKVKQKTETAKENALNFIADNGGFVDLDGFNKKSNIEKEEITSLKHEINTLANSIKNNNTANISVEQQINEANYYIEKGTLLSKTIKANSLSEITPELLLKINDPSVVNFEVDGKKYSYIDMKQELGMISKPNTNIKEIISNPNNSLAVKGENSYNYVNAEIKTVFNENVNFGKSFLGLLLTPLTLITRFKNDSVLTNPDICNKIVNEGIYHFTSEQTAHKILESGYVKESNPMISYGNKKSFFFAGIPEFQDLALNLNKLETKRVAVKIKIDENGLSDFNYRSMTDNALSHNGNYNFDSSKAEIVYLGLFEENGKLVYKEMPKTNWDSYKCDINSNKINNAYGNIGSYLIALGKEVEVFTNSMNKIKNNILNVTSKIKVNDNFKALANKPLKLYSDAVSRFATDNGGFVDLDGFNQDSNIQKEKILQQKLDSYDRLIEKTKNPEYIAFIEKMNSGNKVHVYGDEVEFLNLRNEIKVLEHEMVTLYASMNSKVSDIATNVKINPKHFDFQNVGLKFKNVVLNVENKFSSIKSSVFSGLTNLKNNIGNIINTNNQKLRNLKYADLIKKVNENDNITTVGDLKQSIIESIPSGLTNFEKARFLYLELSKRVGFDENLNSNPNEKIGFKILTDSKDINDNSLINGKIICKSWSKIYNELLLSVGINSEIKSANHAWVEFEVNGMYFLADATKNTAYLNDLAKISQGEQTNMFYPINKFTTLEDAQLGKYPFPLANVDIKSFYDSILEVDKGLNYIKENYNNVLDKVCSNIENNNVSSSNLSNLVENKLLKLNEIANISKLGYVEAKSYILSFAKSLSSAESDIISGTDLYRLKSNGNVELINITSIKQEDGTYKYFAYHENTGIIEINTHDLSELILSGFKTKSKNGIAGYKYNFFEAIGSKLNITNFKTGKMNLDKNKITSLNHEINTLANSIKNTNTFNISVEQQINEANHYIGKKGNYEIQLNNINDISLEMLLKIKNTKFVIFNLDNNKYNFDQITSMVVAQNTINGAIQLPNKNMIYDLAKLVDVDTKFRIDGKNYIYDYNINNILLTFDHDYTENRYVNKTKNKMFNTYASQDIATYYKDGKQYMRSILPSLLNRYQNDSIAYGKIQNALQLFENYQINEIDLVNVLELISPYLDGQQLATIYSLTQSENSMENILTEEEKYLLQSYTKSSGPLITAYLRQATTDFAKSNGVYNGKDIYSIANKLAGCFGDRERVGIHKSTELKKFYIDENTVDVNKVCKALDKIIEKSPGIQEDMILYRGVDGIFLDGNKINTYDIGQKFNDQSYLSTSLLSRNIFNSNIMLAIAVPKGTKAAYIETNTGAGNYCQQEMLLARGMTYEITGLPYTKYDSNNKEITVIPVKVVPNVKAKSYVDVDVDLFGISDKTINKKFTAKSSNVESNKKVDLFWNAYNQENANLPEQVNIEDFYSTLKKSGLLQVYNESIENMKELYKDNDVLEHGISHAQRVMQFALYIGNSMNLSGHDLQLLLDTTKFHDSGLNSNVERFGREKHGELASNKASNMLSQKYSQEDIKVIMASIDYHAYIDSEFNFTEMLNKYNITDKTSIDKFKLISTILKDADALDRTRFANNLDPRYLRTNSALSLVKTSYQIQEQLATNQINYKIQNNLYTDGQLTYINTLRQYSVPDALISYMLKFKGLLHPNAINNVNNKIREIMYANNKN